jgi:hypothetical protein
MLSPHIIRKTIKNLHLDYNLDFRSLDSSNYSDLISLLSNNEKALHDFRVFAIYSREMNAFNSQATSYFDQFIIEACNLNDYQSIIELDNLLYSDDHIFLTDSENILSKAKDKYSDRMELNEYQRHYYKKYYAFSKYGENLSSDMSRHTEKHASIIISDILNGTMACFSKQDIDGLKSIIYKHSNDFKLVEACTIYLLNKVALGGDPAYQRSIHMFYDLMSEGLVSADMAALIIAFGDDQLFDVLLDTLTVESMRAIVSSALNIIEIHKKRPTIDPNVNDRIFEVFNKWTQSIIHKSSDVGRIANIFGHSSLDSVRCDQHRHMLLNCLERLGKKGQEAIQIVLKEYDLSDVSKLSLDMNHCPSLAALKHLLPVSVRRQLLESDLTL